MDAIISAVLGEVITRSINFLISKSSKPKVSDVEDSLQRVLLRAQVILDEATGRHITNQAMLQQLGMLRDAMYQGNYLFDTSRYQFQDVEDTKDPSVSHSLSLCNVNSLIKGTSSSNRKTEILEQLQYSVDNLSSMILDVKELVGFLMSYPRLYRQPYSMHLLLSNCMFGRQMEAHLVFSFLLNTEPHGSEELEVLPIVGPCLVGKSTLVSHVCMDERVSDHFSEILLLSGHDFTNDIFTLRKGCAVEHQKNVLNTNKDRRLLVVELAGDVREDAWNKLFSSYKQHVPRGSKIIVTSRSDKVVKFGTVPPLHLKYLSSEAYWYFFKTLTFGSTDPKMHPRFAHVAMEIARTTIGVCFLRANIIASLLRKNFDIHFWCKVLTHSRRVIQKNVTRYGGHPFDLLNQNSPVSFWPMATPSDELVLHCWFRRSSEDEIPKMNIRDVLYGNVKPQGKFEFLSWKSRIPPYCTYVTFCEIREQKTAATKRKRSAK